MKGEKINWETRTLSLGAVSFSRLEVSQPEMKLAIKTRKLMVASLGDRTVGNPLAHFRLAV